MIREVLKGQRWMRTDEYSQIIIESTSDGSAIGGSGYLRGFIIQIIKSDSCYHVAYRSNLWNSDVINDDRYQYLEGQDKAED